MLWMKNGQKSKVTNCTPIGNTQKLKRFHEISGLVGLHSLGLIFYDILCTINKFLS